MDKVKIKNPLIYLLVLPIKIYQIFVSPMLSSSCRFQPTCSQYSIESLQKFGLLRGLYYSIVRLKSCHPFGKSGYDPVKENLIFKQITLEKIKEFRIKNLYYNLPKSLADYETDSFKNTKHYGLYIDGLLVSGLTIIKTNKKYFKCFQIRGMFTIKKKENKGYGSKLLFQVIKLLKQSGVELVWCNSRASAINFYKKNKFQEVGSTFKINHIGDHKKLVRYL